MAEDPKKKRTSAAKKDVTSVAGEGINEQDAVFAKTSRFPSRTHIVKARGNHGEPRPYRQAHSGKEGKPGIDDEEDVESTEHAWNKNDNFQTILQKTVRRCAICG